MGTIRAINPHRRRTSQRIALSNQSDQSLAKASGRTSLIARTVRQIVGGMRCCPIDTIRRESRRSGWRSRGIRQAPRQRPGLNRVCAGNRTDCACFAVTGA